MYNSEENIAKRPVQSDVPNVIVPSKYDDAKQHSVSGEPHGGIAQICTAAQHAEPVLQKKEIVCPIRPLGHARGSYYFISPAGELRNMKAEALEAGRGVAALFTGMGNDVEEWCLSQFPARDERWSPKDAGKWIIEQCNSKGIFDLESADLRSLGTWRDVDDAAVAHCGDRLVHPDGTVSIPQTNRLGQSGPVMIGAKSIPKPDFEPVLPDTFKGILHELEASWGWKRKEDAAIWLGWVASASLGGFPSWRTHLCVHGSRGSGKSTLMEIAACLMGSFAGDVINDATEAGLRQSRNNQARPLLIDEFEPDDNPRNTSQQERILALLRRMSGGAGGRISRGGADHSSVSFRALGAAYVTSINHIHFQPQDRSRFVLMELGTLPTSEHPGSDVETLKKRCRKLSAKFHGRMLAQSPHWDENNALIAARARSLGADARQADTAASILTGLDLLLFDGAINQLRLDDLEPLLLVLIGDGAESDHSSEGLDALEFLLSNSLPLDHGLKRTVRELVNAAMFGEECIGVENPSAELARVGIYPLPKKGQLAVRSGGATPVAKFFSGTKWRAGAHASALRKLDGVISPKGPIRVAPRQQMRVLLIESQLLRSSE